MRSLSGALSDAVDLEALPVSHRRADVVDPADWGLLAAELQDGPEPVRGLVSCAGVTWRASSATCGPRTSPGSTRPI